MNSVAHDVRENGQWDRRCRILLHDVQHQRSDLGRLVPEHVGRLDQRLGLVDVRGIVVADGRDRLSLREPHTELHVHAQPDRRVDRVLLALPAAANDQRRQADLLAVDGRHEAVLTSHDVLARPRLPQHHGVIHDPRIATLELDHVAETLQPGAAGERILDLETALLVIRGHPPAQDQHPRSERDDQLPGVGRPAVLENLDRLLDLQGVAHVPADRLVHAGQERHGSHAVAIPDADHGPGQLASALHGLHERATAELHIQHQASDALSELLAHDGGRDQGDRLDRARDVAQSVHLPIRGHQRIRLPNDAAPDLAHATDEPTHRQVGAKTGDGLHLVQRPAGVPEPTARDHGHANPARRDQRCQRNGDLVPDAARGVLVHLGAGNAGEVHDLARVDHGLGPHGQLGRVQAAPADRHQHGGHLVFRNLAGRVRADELADVVRREHPAVALEPDQLSHQHLTPPLHPNGQSVG